MFYFPKRECFKLPSSFRWMRAWCIGNAIPQHPSWIGEAGRKKWSFPLHSKEWPLLMSTQWSPLTTQGWAALLFYTDEAPGTIGRHYFSRKLIVRLKIFREITFKNYYLIYFELFHEVNITSALIVRMTLKSKIVLKSNWFPKICTEAHYMKQLKNALHFQHLKRVKKAKIRYLLCITSPNY